jgi:hypothetical protein
MSDVMQHDRGLCTCGYEGWLYSLAREVEHDIGPPTWVEVGPRICGFCITVAIEPTARWRGRRLARRCAQSKPPRTTPSPLARSAGLAGRTALRLGYAPNAASLLTARAVMTAASSIASTCAADGSSNR